MEKSLKDPISLKYRLGYLFLFYCSLTCELTLLFNLFSNFIREYVILLHLYAIIYLQFVFVYNYYIDSNWNAPSLWKIFCFCFACTIFLIPMYIERQILKMKFAVYFVRLGCMRKTVNKCRPVAHWSDHHIANVKAMDWFSLG